MYSISAYGSIITEERLQEDERKKRMNLIRQSSVVSFGKIFNDPFWATYHHQTGAWCFDDSSKPMKSTSFCAEILAVKRRMPVVSLDQVFHFYGHGLTPFLA